LRWRWILDIADLLEFLHAQIPFSMPLGRVTPASFEVLASRVWLTDLALDLPPSARTIEADLRGFSGLVAYVFPEIADRIIELGQDASEPSLETIRAVINGTLGGDAKRCDCGAGVPSSSRFCIRCGQASASGPTGATALIINLESESQGDILTSWNEQRTAKLHPARLASAIESIRQRPGFDRLVCIDRLPHLIRMFYQEEAALRVLRGMRGRALLADEVGLGKTIEAGLVLKELIVRGLVDRVLVVCPQSLATQWQSEMFEKFDELLLVLGRDIDSTLAWQCGRLIASYASIEERWHAEELSRQNYDLVILDEAHYLNDSANARALETVRNVRKRYFLLLSATPMHNDLAELHTILTLLRPGHVGSKDDFLATYDDPGAEVGARNLDGLRRIVQEVMIRNLRSDVAKDHRFPRRRAIRRELEPSVHGKDVYREIQELLRKYASAGPLRKLLLDRGGLAERVTSSRAAVRERVGQIAGAVGRRGGDSILRPLRLISEDPRLDDLVEPKVNAMIEVIQARVSHRNSRERCKVLVFSQFNATARMLYARLRAVKLPVFLYDEETDRNTKDRTIGEFYRSGPSALVCPGEAEEGLNLQFARTMVNYDLPWDPMRIEQRIGRIQRLGNAESEVEVVNLILKGTIEEDIIDILERKIRMFEAVVGPLQAILGNLEKGEDPQQWVGDIFLDLSLESDDGQTIGAREHCEQAIEDADRRGKEGRARMLNALFSEADDYGTDGR
jgi:SNF2 family DNA or RNA helicase